MPLRLHAGPSGTTQWHNGSRGRAVLRTVKPKENEVDADLRERSRSTRTSTARSVHPVSVRHSNGLFLPVEGSRMDAGERTAKVGEIFIRLLKKFTAQRQPVNHLVGSNRHAADTAWRAGRGGRNRQAGA